jgi:transposase
MTPPPDLSSLDSSAKDALIVALLARVDELCARVAELEAKLGLPPKTPDNSSTPPSQGRKAAGDATTKAKGKPHAGAHRPLHPDPTSKRDLFASSCQHCGADVSHRPQIACDAYDHVEIPDIKPDVVRVTRHGGTCACCGKRFKAPAPVDMPPGSPFGPNLRALVIYLRFTQGIAFERLARLLSDLLGLDISEGALVNMLDAARDAFAAQTSAIRSRLLSGTALESDETGLRVGKKNWWLWVFDHADSAVFVAAPTRAKSVVEAFLGDFRPAFCVGPLRRANGLGENGQSGLPRPSHPRRAIRHRRRRSCIRAQAAPSARARLPHRSATTQARRRDIENLRGAAERRSRRTHGA